MVNESLEMPEKPRKSSSRTILLVVLGFLALGLAVWILVSGGEKPQIIDSAIRQIDSVLDRPLEGASTPPAGGGSNSEVRDLSGGPQASAEGAPVPVGQAGQPGASTPGNIVEPPTGYVESATSPGALPLPGAEGTEGAAASATQTGEQAAGSTGTEEEPDPDPDHVDRAIAGESSSSLELTPAERAALTIARGNLQDNSAPAEASLRQDSVVSWDFVNNLARWLVASYQPGSAGKAGRSSATLISANMRYGSALTGLRHTAAGPSKGRMQILDYAFTPGMLDALHRLYGELFLEAMHQASLEKSVTSHAPLSVQQEADMFKVYAGLCQRLAASFRGAAATDDLHNLVEGVRQAGQEVVQTSGAFAELLFAYEEAKENGDKSLEENLRERMVEYSRNSELAHDKRSQARDALSSAIKRRAGGTTAGNDSLIYLGEWLDRRGEITKVAPAANMAAELCTRLAEQMNARAERLLAE